MFKMYDYNSSNIPNPKSIRIRKNGFNATKYKSTDGLQETT